MKLNMKMPYGEVYGHPFAAYEQGGILFDGAGESLEQPILVKDTPPVAEVTDFSPNYQAMQAKDFLLGILKEGPLTQTAIYKEAENNNQNWEEVKQAFIAIGGETFKQRNGFYWKLKSE